MSEINVTAGRYVPDKPKTIASEQLEVYVPVAGYNNTGTASYDPNSFIVDDGNVKLRRNPVRVVTEISQIDATTGKATITYDDCNMPGSVGAPLVRVNCKIVEPGTFEEKMYGRFPIVLHKEPYQKGDFPQTGEINLRQLLFQREQPFLLCL